MKNIYIQPDTTIVNVNLLGSVLDEDAASVGWYDDDGVWHPGKHIGKGGVIEEETEFTKGTNLWDSWSDDEEDW